MNSGGPRCQMMFTGTQAGTAKERFTEIPNLTVSLHAATWAPKGSVVLDCGCTTLKIILRLRLQNFQHHTTTINKIYFPKGSIHGFKTNHQQQDMNNRILKI